MTAEEIRQIYIKSLNDLTEQMKQATTPEFNRLSNELDATKEIIKELGKVAHEPRLKLFRIIVYPNQTSGIRVRTSIVLDIDIEAAKTYERLEKEQRQDVQEIEGPFKAGFVIHHGR